MINSIQIYKKNKKEVIQLTLIINNNVKKVDIFQSFYKKRFL